MGRRHHRESEIVRPLSPIAWLLARAAALVVAFVAAFGLALTGLWVWSFASAHAAHEHHFSRAGAGFLAQQSLTRHGPEPWRAPANLGTVRLQAGRLDEGVAHLRRALTLLEPPGTATNPPPELPPTDPRCFVRVNLAWGLRAQAERDNPADPAASPLHSEADTLAHPCTPPSPVAPPGDGDNPSPPDPSPSPADTTGPGSDDDSAETQRRERLRERNQRAKEQQQSGDGRSGLPEGKYW